MKKIMITLSLLLMTFNVYAAKRHEIGPSLNVDPVWLEDRRESLYPLSNKPAETVYTFNTRQMPFEDVALAVSAQGLINKDKPQLYLSVRKPGGTAASNENLEKDHDAYWFEWLLKEKYIQKTKEIKTLEELLGKWTFKRVVVIDPEMPGSYNIATMVAACENVPVAYPEHIKEFGFEIAVDLRGKFKTNVEAYQWVFDTYWDQMDHSVLAWYSPEKKFCHLRDYLVSKKIFTFWITGKVDGQHSSADSKKEKEFFRKLLTRMPVNIPVLGFPWAGPNVGIGEQQGVVLMGRTGKFLTCCDWKANLSVWTGLKAKNLNPKQLPPREIKLEEGKVYAALLMSDGDNLNTWVDYFYPYWQSPNRGKIPIGWTMGPSLIDMHGPLVDYYYGLLTDTDSIGCSVTGVGYILSAYFAHDIKEEYKENVWNQYLDLTDKYMKKMDMDWLHIFRASDVEDVPYDKLAAIPSVKTLMSDYGGSLPYNKTLSKLGDVTIIHALKGTGGSKTYQRIIENTPKETPSFIYVFLNSWEFKPEHIAALVKQLPDNFVLVRPDELSNLYNQWSIQK